jgi:hypothetical protein
MYGRSNFGAHAEFSNINTVSAELQSLIYGILGLRKDFSMIQTISKKIVT